MTLLSLSDTHALHRSLKPLPAADVIVHCGDICNAGTARELSDFINWFTALDYPRKIFVAGNHDRILSASDPQKLQATLPENMTYLYNSGIEIEGVRFWGISYNADRDELATIPADIDVLISHEPPQGILDYEDRTHFGSPELLQTVQQINPKYHLFGHIHTQYGIKKTPSTTFINAALFDRGYLPRKPIRFRY